MRSSRNQRAGPDAGQSVTPRRLEAFLLAVVAAAFVALFARYGPVRNQTTDDRPMAAGGHTVHLTVAPIFGRHAAEELRPLVPYFMKSVRMRVAIEQAESTSAAVDALATGQTSFALLPALGCVQARERSPEIQYVAAHAVAGRWTTTAVLVVPRDAPTRRLEELSNARICAAAPESTAGHLLLRAALRNRGLRPAKVVGQWRWSGDHERAIDDLLAGHCDAAAIPRYALDARPDRASLREVARLGVAPPGCWAARGGLEPALVGSMVAALASFEPRYEIGRPWLGRTLRITDLHSANPSTFRAVFVSARIEGLMPPPQLQRGEEGLPNEKRVVPRAKLDQHDGSQRPLPSAPPDSRREDGDTTVAPRPR